MQYNNYKDRLYSELLERSVNDKLISKFYKNILEYLLTKFSTLVYIDDQNDVKKVPCWHGSAERVIAKIKQESNLILPVISVFRLNDAKDDSRRRQESLVVFETYFDPEKQRAVRIASLAPVPIKLNYRVSIWTKYHQDMDHLSEQFRRFFNPHMIVSTVDATQINAYLGDEQSQIDLTLEDGQDRLVKRMFDITIETYIPSPKFMVTHTGAIEEFNSEILTEE